MTTNAMIPELRKVLKRMPSPLEVMPSYGSYLSPP